ncbi:MAG: STAS domain-containing protein [Bacillus sp. (in: firmicutes)]
MNKLKVTELENEIEILKKRIEEYEAIIADIAAPIIPSIVPETILVPITGKLIPERFEKITAKLLNYSANTDITAIVLDFSAISNNDIGEIDVFGYYIGQLSSSLNLVGVKVLFVGFSPSITHKLITSGLSTDHQLNTFMSFKKALQHLMKEKGLELSRLVK